METPISTSIQNRYVSEFRVMARIKLIFLVALLLGLSQLYFVVHIEAVQTQNMFIDKAISIKD